MTQVTEAIYSDGVLKPAGRLSLHDQQRVRIIVQPLDPISGEDRARAVANLKAGIEQMKFKSNGSYPTRDELHERG